MKPREVTQYLDETRSVEGWLFPVDAHLFGVIDEIQKNTDVRGNLFEIGVHHGKTALLLARMRADTERLGVCDVFGSQELNVDHSGEGSRELFVRHLQTFTASRESDVDIFAKRSDQLTATDTTSACRFFHIDGGHLPSDVLSDLSSAEGALLPQGVVAVDDVFNCNWPGVAEGFFEFVSQRPDALVPIMIGGNKIFLCRPAAADLYASSVFDNFHAIYGLVPFTIEWKHWLGLRVPTAIRHQWVDLNPLAAARDHLSGRSWRERFFRLILG